MTKILWQDTFQTSTSQKVYSVWGGVGAQRAPRLRSTLLKYWKSGPFFSFSSVTLFYHAFLSRSGTFWKIFGQDISAKCLAADPDNLPKCFPDTPIVFNEYFLNCLTWTKALDAENKNNYEIKFPSLSFDLQTESNTFLFDKRNATRFSIFFEQHLFLPAWSSICDNLSWNWKL